MLMAATKKKARVAWWRSLERLGACGEAVEFAKTHKSFGAAWKACKRGDWMLWIIGRGITCELWSDGRKKLTAAAIDCARLALPHAGKWREEIAKNLDALTAWTNGTASVEDAKAAREALWKTWRAAAADAAADAAAAAYAAAAADADAAAAAAAAAYAAAAAAAAAYAYADADAAAAARSRVLAECADLVRKHYPKPPRVS
jgi:hypothetical protein